MLTNTYSINQAVSEGRSGVHCQNRAESPFMRQGDTVIQNTEKQHESIHRRIVALRWEQRKRKRIGREPFPAGHD